MGKKKKYPEPFRAAPVEVPAEVQEALDVGLEITRVIEEDIDDHTKVKHDDYFESCAERAEAICATIHKKNTVTENQRAALDNILAGLRKWVHDDDD